MGTRQVIERIARPLRLKRRLPKEFGSVPLWVSPAAGLKFLFRKMADTDPVLLRLTRQFVREGQVVWDIGANVGLFAFAAAHLSGSKGSVMAMEPDASLVSMLRRSAAMQPKSSAKVEVVPAAAAAAVDIRRFNIARRSNAANALKEYGSTQMGGVREDQLVLAVSLDWCSERLPPPDLIKIDVEGAELEVLQGAEKLIGAKRPVVLCEVGSDKAAAVAMFFKKHGYKIYDGEEPGPERGEAKSAPWSTIAIPQ